jgi:hypothetical protein
MPPQYSRGTREACEKSGTGEMDDGSRSEVRGSRNFEPRTSNFVSRFSPSVSLESGIGECSRNAHE